jgi:hypothetical protein
MDEDEVKIRPKGLGKGARPVNALRAARGVSILLLIGFSVC